MRYISLFCFIALLTPFIWFGAAESPGTPDMSNLTDTEMTSGNEYQAMQPDESDIKAGLISTTDLAIAGSITPKVAEMGFPFSASIFVVNTGPADAQEIRIDYYLVSNGSEAEPIWIHQKTAEKIPAFYHDNVAFTTTMPGGIDPGEYLLYATIQTNTTDRNLTNNQYRSVKPIEIRRTVRSQEPGSPDLSVTLDSVEPENTAPGYPLTIIYTVTNTGDKSSGTFHIGFYLSEDQEITPSDLKIWDDICYESYPGMTEHGVSRNIIPTDLIPGEYYLGAIVDFTHMVHEDNSDNNIALYGSQVTIRDLHPPIDDAFLEKVAGYVAVKTDRYREYQGLSPLQYDSDLGKIALAHSIDMGSRGYFSHESPEGRNPSDRAKSAHYDTVKLLPDGTQRTGIAENIVKISSGHSVGKGFSGFVDPSDPQAVADVMMIEWISSPVHNKNLVNKDIDHIGVGVAYDGEYFYGTQDFF